MLQNYEGSALTTASLCSEGEADLLPIIRLEPCLRVLGTSAALSTDNDKASNLDTLVPRSLCLARATVAILAMLATAQRQIRDATEMTHRMPI